MGVRGWRVSLVTARPQPIDGVEQVTLPPVARSSDWLWRVGAARRAIAALAPFGRVVAVGLGNQPVPVYPYQEIINREAEIIGCSDHLASEIPLLTELVRRRVLDLAPVVTETIPLEALAINAVMDLSLIHI